MPHGTLVYIEDYTSATEPDGKLHLAYRFDIYAAEPLSRTAVYVSADDGKILFTNAIIKHTTATGNSMYSGNVTFQTTQVGSAYHLKDATRGHGINTYDNNYQSFIGSEVIVTNPTTTFPSSVALDAHWGAAMVYDYWKNVHNRLSYNGLDSPLNSIVRYGVNYDNAFWDGVRMTYGDGSGVANGGFGPMASLDICAHEIGHGICEYTCDLVYNREPGAMNEGFSDIWGAVIEYVSNPNETDAKAKNPWEMGEEVGAEPLRSMANPKRYGQPDTYGGTNWVNASPSCVPSGANDNCGVHTNSGVLNYWFYLLANGGTGTNDLNNPYAVPAIGITDAAKIAYGAELALGTTSNYAACRAASINYATTLFGACSVQEEAVTRAWHAVGVGGPFAPCTPQISFAAPVTQFTEDAGTNACPASRTVTIPVVLNGPSLTGGNPTVTVSVAGGTAVAGRDYDLNTTTVTFQAGTTAPQHITMTIYDNGSSDTDKYVDLQFTLAANGSNATVANVLTQQRIVISNDDRAPELGGDELHTVGNSTVISNMTSPFFTSAKGARTQYILTVPELVAAGLRPNTPIKALSWYVTQKYSVLPFNGYTVKLAATAANNFSTAFLTGFTQVYNGNYTTDTGWNVIPFSTNYVWNGTSNIAVEICFTNAAAGPANFNDRVWGAATGGTITAYNYNSATTNGCVLAFNPSRVSNAKPVTRFTQDVPPTPVEGTAGATRTWDMHAGQKVYFYSEADSELIAAVLQNTADLGCVTATLSAQGTGFAPASFAAVNRSLKEVTLTPVLGNTGVNYDAVIYFLNTELGNVNKANVRILKTDALTDAGISTANSQIVVPALVTGTNYTGFRGSFTGFSRFFLLDGPASLGVGSLSGNTPDIRVDANPFQQEITISYRMMKTETGQIRLLDMTGKLVYHGTHTLQAGQHRLQLAPGAHLAPGHYLLQIVHDSGVWNRQLLKN